MREPPARRGGGAHLADLASERPRGRRARGGRREREGPLQRIAKVGAGAPAPAAGVRNRCGRAGRVARRRDDERQRGAAKAPTAVAPAHAALVHSRRAARPVRVEVVLAAHICTTLNHSPP